MPTITTPNTGLELFYDEHGDPSHPPILLVMGLGAQMTLWPTEFVEALAGRGYRVIRYDNRDIGLSHKFDGAKAPSLPWQVIRQKIRWPAKVPYTLKDMADDGAGVLEALGIGQAHVVGASMGGMIAQLMAVHHGHKLHSLTSIFSTTGNPQLPQADKPAIEALTAPLTSMAEEDLVAHGLKVVQAIGSPGYRPDPEWQRERVRKAVQRSVYPAGLPRQLAAIIDDGDRTERLANVTAPTLVLHGEDDPLVKVEGGRATAQAIPDAKLVTIPGWGHDLPLALVDRITAEIDAHVQAAGAKASVAA
ncbi:MAG: alpha/beta hydrolase [Pseudomonadota bacterium]